jgi:phosphate/sulfate permease
MKHVLKWVMKRLKLDKWLNEGAPAFWVVGMSIVILGAILGTLSAVFVTFDWRFPEVVISWLICALVASLVGLILWFVVDALTAKERPTTWRK